MIDIAMTSANH